MVEAVCSITRLVAVCLRIEEHQLNVLIVAVSLLRFGAEKC